MKRFIILIAMAIVLASSAQAGLRFGIQAGAYSPTKGIEDNDNGLIIGGDIWFKFTVVGLKIEGFYVDSSGALEDQLGSSFGEAQIDVDSMFNADFMWFPIGTTFFAQGGVNLINYDVHDIDQEVLDNELGFEIGAGLSLFDKLLVQGKILYTPNAVKDGAVETIEGLDDSDIQGYMVTVGWHF